MCVSVIVCDLETSKQGVLGPSGAVTPQNNGITAHATLVVALFWVRSISIRILVFATPL